MGETLRYAILLLAIAHQIVEAQPAPAPTKVIGAHGVWWILNDQGALASFDGNRIVAQHLSGSVRDIARMPNGDLLALIENQKTSHAVVMEHVASGDWRQFAKLTNDAADRFIGLAVSDSNVVIVSSRALYSLRSRRSQRRQRMHGITIRQGLQPAIALTASRQLYVGENAGEFGGGLIRIDVATGVSEHVERRENGCDGPLNSECNPVTAVIPDRTDGRCVIASIGLRHLDMEEGRVLRVCGTSVKVVVELPCPQQPPHGRCSLGIFGLAPDSSGFWATTGSALYHIRADTIDQKQSMPKLRRLAGLAYSDAIPGLLVLSTNINWQRSTSGPTPLIGSRR